MKRILYIILLSVLAFTACTKQDAGNILPGNGERVIVFSLKSGNLNENSRSTPGVESLNENHVESLDVFFFNNEGDCLFYPETSQMTRDGATVKIDIPESAAANIFNKNVRLYVVANAGIGRGVMEGKTYDELIRVVQSPAKEFNAATFAPQADFLMDGLLDLSNLTADRTDLGTVTLSRAAAKVVVNIISADIEGYTAIDAQVRMNGYLESTVLGKEAPLYDAQANDFMNSPYRAVWFPESGQPQFDSDPFYSYANDWQYGDVVESYMTVKVRWQKDGVEPKDYYYRLPFNYETPDGERRFRLDRNYIYTFNVDIGVLGGLDPDDLIDLTPSFVIKDWTTDFIVANLNQYDYLLVSEHNIEINNINHKTIEYASSKPIEIVDCTAYFNTYNSSNSDVTKNEYYEGDANFPLFSIDETGNTITMTSPVPINYVPVYIEFTVKNTAGLTKKVKVAQYPPIFITSEFSNRNDIDFQWYKEEGWSSFWSNNGNGSESPKMQNFNLYTVTTNSLSLEDDFVIGGNIMEKVYNLTEGDSLYVTKSSAEANRMVSPKFVIASQRGITSSNTAYQTAQVRCVYYMEGPYARGTWRMPTEAEMLLISRLQRDGNSAIKELFKPASSASETWWTARKDIAGKDEYHYSVKMMTGDLIRQLYVAGKTYASIRCVRDVWRD